MRPMNPQAAWYPDPNDPAQWRYWDGSAWTDHYAPRVPPPPPPVTTPSTVVQVTVEPAAVVSLFAQTAVAFQPDALPSLGDIVQQLSHEPLRHPLDEQVELAGETFAVGGIKKVFREHKVPITSEGTTIEEASCVLVPERWNPHDPHAVAVLVGLHQVGYIPAALAKNYSPPLLRLASSGALVTGVARIWAKDESGMLRARVTALLPEASTLF